MPDLIPERLREIEARCEAATAPPWSRCSASDGHCSCHLIWSRSADEVVCKFYSHKDDDCGEGFTEEQAERNANFIENSRDDVPDLLAALKQAREERDQFAAATDEARRRLEHIQNCQRPPTVTQEQFIFNLQANASLALVNIADPAECLKARDVEIRYRVIREMGRNGGVKGAATLNAKLTQEERKASASKAAKSRWADSAGGKR